MPTPRGAGGRLPREIEARAENRLSHGRRLPGATPGARSRCDTPPADASAPTLTNGGPSRRRRTDSLPLETGVKLRGETATEEAALTSAAGPRAPARPGPACGGALVSARVTDGSAERQFDKTGSSCAPKERRINGEGATRTGTRTVNAPTAGV